MIPPLVLPCDACGRPFLASLDDMDDDAILCNACWTPPDRESLDGLAGEIFKMFEDMAAMHSRLYNFPSKEW
jgi:hypothetical protein